MANQQISGPEIQRPQVIEGINVYFVPGLDTAALTRVCQSAAVPPDGTATQCFLVLDLPADLETVRLVALIESTLPLIDAYTIAYANRPDKRYTDPDDEDIELDTPEGVPRVLQSVLHIDVPYELVPDRATALVTAWKHAQPGDSLVVAVANAEIAQASREALDIIRRLVPEGQEPPEPPAPEIDENRTNRQP